MTSRSYFGKMNSTLGSVVPLAMFERWEWVLRKFEACHYKILTRVDESCSLYSSPDHIGLKVEKTNLKYVKSEVD